MAEPKPKPTLLTLPSEIRERIWKYACDDSTAMLTWADGRSNRYLHDEECDCPYQARYDRSGMLLVCRQIYGETVIFFLQNTRLYCHEQLPLSRLRGMFTQKWRDNLFDLAIGFHGNAALTELLSGLPSLKVLRLHSQYKFFRASRYLLPGMSAVEVLHLIGKPTDIVKLVRQNLNIDLHCSTLLEVGLCILVEEPEPNPEYVSPSRTCQLPQGTDKLEACRIRQQVHDNHF